MYLLHPLRAILAKLVFTAFISPISETDSAKSDGFDLKTDLELTCDRQKIQNFI